MNKYRVLFLCTGNSCRSQMAEAILKDLEGDKFISESAGSSPSKNKFPETQGVHPFALETLKNNGYNIDNLHSKSWDFFINIQDDIDFVFTLCGSAKDEMSSEQCPFFPGKALKAHWGLDDPDKAKGTDEEIKTIFQGAFNIIKKRILVFLDLKLNEMEKDEILTAIKEIGKII